MGHRLTHHSARSARVASGSWSRTPTALLAGPAARLAPRGRARLWRPVSGRGGGPGQGPIAGRGALAAKPITPRGRPPLHPLPAAGSLTLGVPGPGTIGLRPRSAGACRVSDFRVPGPDLVETRAGERWSRGSGSAEQGARHREPRRPLSPAWRPHRSVTQGAAAACVCVECVCVRGEEKGEEKQQKRGRDGSRVPECLCDGKTKTDYIWGLLLRASVCECVCV